MHYHAGFILWHGLGASIHGSRRQAMDFYGLCVYRSGSYRRFIRAPVSGFSTETSVI
jgi:hypothetical protein